MSLSKEELKIAWKAYYSQKKSCENKLDKNKNPVEMKLTFEEWLDIWITSGHWNQRGKRKGEYCMSRHNDIGHYELGNVSIELSSVNSSKGNNEHLSESHKNNIRNALLGKKRPKEVIDKMVSNRKSNRPIITPEGVFPTISAAARFYKVDPSTISYNAKKQRNGFNFFEN